jgi:hypothetical protein
VAVLLQQRLGRTRQVGINQKAHGRQSLRG